MPVSVNWATKIITVPADVMTLISGGGGPGSLYELNVDTLHHALRDLEDDTTGMVFPVTHAYVGAVTLAGVTFAPLFQVINGYQVEFPEVSLDRCTIRCVGANHNIGDVKVLNTVSLIIGNSAGLIQVTSGSGLSTDQATQLIEIWRRLGLELGTPVTATPTSLVAGTINQTITEAGTSRTVTREP